jgi:hypothetical protein
MRRAVADHMGRHRYARNNQADQVLEREVERIVWEGGDMSATAKIIGAAGAGAFASWLVEGDYSMRGFIRLFGALIAAGFMAIVVVYLVPVVNDAAEVARIGVAGVVGGFSSHIFRRIVRADLSAKIGGVGIESDGLDEKGNDK